MEELGIRERLEAKTDSIPEDKIPDVTGMGARDAVYELQKRGLKVNLHGKGHVKSQSIPAGSIAERGKTITIQLEQISK